VTGAAEKTHVPHHAAAVAGTARTETPPMTTNQIPPVPSRSSTNTPATPAPTTDFAAVKSRQHGAWSCGDYAVVGTTLQIVGELLCEAVDLHAGARVLDVAAGNGNASLAAARRHCDVVSTDYVPALLERGRERATAERLPVEFRVADAEALPFADGSFDAVLSTFGVMFTPDQERAASELLRVTRRHGRIGLANWTPTGFIGQVFACIGAFVPPPAGVVSPAAWGTRERLQQLFARHALVVDVQVRQFVFRYRSPEHWLEVFKIVYGPMVKAFAALPVDGQAALTAALLSLVQRHNRANDRSMAVASDYLEVVITRR
jgi:ubiquinone/menaquinone biosynthesis C-methylase UbiE